MYRLLSPTLVTRREFLRIGGVTITGLYLEGFARPLNVKATGKANPRGSAQYCIFVMLNGGPSHVDGFDIKEGPWTPQDFDIRTIKREVKMPYGLFPNLCARFDHIALVRSVEAWDSVHGRAQYYVQAARPLNLALAKEVPPVGVVVAYEHQARRKETDTFPPYVAMNCTDSQAGLLGSGFLPAKFSPLHLNTQGEALEMAPEADEAERFQKRWEFLQRFDAALRTDSSPEGKLYRDYNDFYQGAYQIMRDPRAKSVFKISEQEHKRYGSSPLGDACVIARNLVKADAGTRYVMIFQNGWDLHAKIYDKDQKVNHYTLCWELDAALANLIEDLAQTPANGAKGKTLLDETLIVCMGEFGRTVGPLTPNKGRDHYQYASTTLFAGGGVKGGRVIGKTDGLGAKVVDSGWHKKRSIYMEDIATTIYSAMGIDWTKELTNTPSGRAFAYIDISSATSFLDNDEITELFV